MGGEGHVDARWRLRRRVAFNGIGSNGIEGWFSLLCGLSYLLMIFMCLLLSFAFLDPRLYALVVSLLFVCGGGRIMCLFWRVFVCRRRVSFVFGGVCRFVCCERWLVHGGGSGSVVLCFWSFFYILS